MVPSLVRVPRAVYRSSGNDQGERAIPEETAIAFTFNTASYAVMMATPQDLEDFAIGFTLTEAVAPSSEAIESVEIVEQEVGIEVRIWLKSPHAADFLGDVGVRLRAPRVVDDAASKVSSRPRVHHPLLTKVSSSRRTR